MNRGIVAALAILLSGCRPPAPPQKPGPPPPVGPAVGQSAPAFSFLDSKGAPYVESGYVGRKAQLLVFGTTSCPMCQAKVADVDAVRQKRGGEVEVAAVLLSETAEKAEKYASEFKAGFRMLLDPQNISIALYKLGNYPHFVLIDKRGVIRYTGQKLPDDAIIEAAAR
ncbi:MAG: TlpA disulfide reductase family protein [Planctomycetota bacterium]